MINSIQLTYQPMYERNEFAYINKFDQWNHTLQLDFVIDQSNKSYDVDSSRYQQINDESTKYVPHNILFCGTDTDLCDTLLATFAQMTVGGNAVTSGVLEINTYDQHFVYGISCDHNTVVSTPVNVRLPNELTNGTIVNRVIGIDNYIDRVHQLPDGFVNNWSVNFGQYVKACYDINTDNKLTNLEYVNDCWFVRYFEQSQYFRPIGKTKLLSECDRTLYNIAILTFVLTWLETYSSASEPLCITIPPRLIDHVDGITKHQFIAHLNRINEHHHCHQAFIFTTDCSLMNNGAFDADNVFIITRDGRQWVRCSDTSTREFRYGNHVTNLYLGRAFDVE